jgi:hypothetical protein
MTAGDGVGERTDEGLKANGGRIVQAHDDVVLIDLLPVLLQQHALRVADHRAALRRPCARPGQQPSASAGGAPQVLEFLSKQTLNVR